MHTSKLQLHCLGASPWLCSRSVSKHPRSVFFNNKNSSSSFGKQGTLWIHWHSTGTCFSPFLFNFIPNHSTFFWQHSSSSSSPRLSKIFHNKASTRFVTLINNRSFPTKITHTDHTQSKIQNLGSSKRGRAQPGRDSNRIRDRDRDKDKDNLKDRHRQAETQTHLNQDKAVTNSDSEDAETETETETETQKEGETETETEAHRHSLAGRLSDRDKLEAETETTSILA